MKWETKSKWELKVKMKAKWETKLKMKLKLKAKTKWKRVGLGPRKLDVEGRGLRERDDHAPRREAG